MPLHLFVVSVDGSTEALHPIEAKVGLCADLHEVWHDGSHFRLARCLLSTKHFYLLRAAVDDEWIGHSQHVRAVGGLQIGRQGLQPSSAVVGQAAAVAPEKGASPLAVCGQKFAILIGRDQDVWVPIIHR
jgi:hypothetical protein